MIDPIVPTSSKVYRLLFAGTCCTYDDALFSLGLITKLLIFLTKSFQLKHQLNVHISTLRAHVARLLYNRYHVCVTVTSNELLSFHTMYKRFKNVKTYNKQLYMIPFDQRSICRDNNNSNTTNKKKQTNKQIK